jgi:hypothetical protein
MSTRKQAIQNHAESHTTPSPIVHPYSGYITIKYTFYCLLMGVLWSLYPAAGRTQGSSDFGQRSGFATAVSAPASSISSPLNPSLLMGSGLSWDYFEAFGLHELRSGYVSGVFEHQSTTYGFQAGFMGFPLFKEWHNGLSISRAISTGRVGMALLTNHTSVEGYGSGVAVGIRFGTQSTFFDQLMLSMVVNNVELTSWGTIDVEYPAEWILGIQWQLHDQISIAAAVLADAQNTPAGYLSFRWSPMSIVQIQVGHDLSTGSWAAGIRVGIGSWMSNLVGAQHQDLGWSRGVGISWRKSPE